jgi:hypothetical protein
VPLRLLAYVARTSRGGTLLIWSYIIKRMLNMSQQYQEMFQEPFANRSPGAYRGSSINRQPSRHFEGYGMPPSGLYTADDHAAQGYDSTPRFDRMPPSNFGSSYPYDNQTWNYGGANTGANPLGGTGRVKPQGRRGQLPTVRLLPMSSRHIVLTFPELA